ncbi:T9SS type A sorting domain-containing protein [Flavobacterium soli]|uniref:T9SS type A sorting domain-containing protein n=1 Tax=Flavobacterium soli TaxID=344881 RepID=UPI0003FC76B6|nr:T9SS type A sorting domain-containing protein [Flavobacterium soli]
MKKITQTIFLLICSYGFSQAPTDAPPVPTRNPANVISMFSNTYTNVPVDTWITEWSAGALEDLSIAGNDVKKYSNLSFVGIETVGPNLIDAGDMLYFHVDIWTPNLTTFRIKLVDFGANGAFQGGDDTEHEIIFETPAQNGWVSYDIPLTNFTNLINKEHIAQLIFSGMPVGTGTVFIDNVYFTNEASTVPTDPIVAAPLPILPQADVISLFSNAYTNVAVDTWKTEWSDATLEDVQIAGDDVKKYDPLVFVGVETVTSQIDASGMTAFNVDVWSPDFTVFKIKLVDFGPNGVFQGGDDSEHEITFNSPAQSTWNSYTIPLAEFENLTSLQHISQIIFVASGAKVYIDNVYFSNETVIVIPSDPTVAAPTPTMDAANVISMFSNAYTNVTVDTWKTDWSDATLEDVQVAGNDTKKYTSLNFVGIETVTSQLDITGMTHFNVDVWSPTFTQFKIKLVDFGANGIFQGGDDVEHELTFDNPAQSLWVTMSIPLTDFVGLTTMENIAQLIFVGGGSKVYVDNVYFSNGALATEDFKISSVKMYPNPVSDFFHVSAEKTIDNITFYNLLGQEILSINSFKNNETINLSGFQSGVYIAKVTVEGKVTTSRIIKK